MGQRWCVHPPRPSAAVAATTSPGPSHPTTLQAGKPKVPWGDVLKGAKTAASPECLDLLERLLAFNPSKRITVEVRDPGGGREAQKGRRCVRCAYAPSHCHTRFQTRRPHRRLPSQEALAHPYLRSLHCPEDEPACPATFDFRCGRARGGVGGAAWIR
jgi:serine/threonine protein kinase